ncbi:hypothetical protein BD779DRAFT_1478448 [Infundibulicybe gibba]|nr:hypothetical protein BD779DRAFT_1478448 [Infundibulicybe gibba]
MRGVLEIDILEAEKGKDAPTSQVVSQSAQFGPFLHDYFYGNTSANMWDVYMPDRTRPLFMYSRHPWRDKRCEGHTETIYLRGHPSTPLAPSNLGAVVSRLDLSSFYGGNREDAQTIRRYDGSGELAPDSFTAAELDSLPAYIQLLLILWNQNHNETTTSLAGGVKGKTRFMRIYNDWRKKMTDHTKMKPVGHSSKPMVLSPIPFESFQLRSCVFTSSPESPFTTFKADGKCGKWDRGQGLRPPEGLLSRQLCMGATSSAVHGRDRYHSAGMTRYGSEDTSLFLQESSPSTQAVGFYHVYDFGAGWDSRINCMDHKDTSDAASFEACFSILSHGDHACPLHITSASLFSLENSPLGKSLNGIHRTPRRQNYTSINIQLKKQKQKGNTLELKLNVASLNHHNRLILVISPTPASRGQHKA